MHCITLREAFYIHTQLGCTKRTCSPVDVVCTVYRCSPHCYLYYVCMSPYCVIVYGQARVCCQRAHWPTLSPTSNPRLLSAEELDERFRTQQAAIREYRAKRQEILRRREGERKERNETKKRQLEWAQELQVRNFTVTSCHHIFNTVSLIK